MLNVFISTQKSVTHKNVTLHILLGRKSNDCHVKHSEVTELRHSELF